MRTLAASAIVLLASGVCAYIGAQAAPVQAQTSGVSVERGKYLVTVQDCNGCHTPFKGGEPDMTRMLSGHPEGIAVKQGPTLPAGWSTAISDTNTAWFGPWGISFTTNLTPDKETGIGTWSEALFVSSIRSGRHLGQGRPILPPMPWAMYRQLTDDDLRSVYRYLMSIPAIRNRVPAAIVAAPPR